MGYGDEVLVIDSADLHVLFPALMVSDDQGGDLLGHHPIRDVPAGPLQIMIDLALAPVGQSRDAAGCVLPLWEVGLYICPNW